MRALESHSTASRGPWLTMPQYFENTALVLCKSYRLALSGAADQGEVNNLIALGRGALVEAEKLAQLRPELTDLSVADWQKLQAAIALIKSILRLLSEHHVGAGLQASENGSSVSWDDVESAFENRIKTGVITNRRYLDLLTFMRDAKKQFNEKVSEILEVPLKVNTVLAAEYAIVKDGEETIEIKYFNTKTAPIYSTTDLNEWFIMNVQNPINMDMEEFQERESSWSLKSILHLVVNIYKFNPMRGSSYIDLPSFIKNKKACINVENKDDEGFKWSILSALYPARKSVNRVTNYVPYKNDLNFKGIDFPVDPRNVSKFEKQNDVSVNVYYLKKKGKMFNVLPRHLTSDKKEKHVKLLLIENNYVEDEDESTPDDDVNIDFKFHYVWIKNLSRLVSQQLSPRNHKTFICDRCLHYFWTEEKLMKHVIDCEKMNNCKITLPTKKNNTLEFTNFGFKNRVPFVIYADFECI